MQAVIPRPILAAAMVAATLLAASARPSAVETMSPVERLVATALDTSGPAAEYVGRIGIVIERWSSQADVERLRAAHQQGPAALLPAIQRARQRVGYLLSPGVQGKGARARMRRAQNLQFAREVRTATGRRVILATDHQLAFGETARGARATDYDFRVLEIRFGADGEGVGKLGAESSVTYNRKIDALELKDYDARPVLLREIKPDAR